MPRWKQLTQTDNVSVDVNMDQVAYMNSSRNSTRIPETVLTFAYAQADRNCVLVVKETVEQIHQRTVM